MIDARTRQYKARTQRILGLGWLVVGFLTYLISVPLQEQTTPPWWAYGAPALVVQLYYYLRPGIAPQAP